MTLRKTLATILFSIFVSLAIGGSQALAQTAATSPSQEEKRTDETNLDTQLYLLVATNQEVDDSKLPAALDPVVKQLRTSLPFKNYRLMTTLVNRVKNEGRLNLKWIGGPLIASTAAANTPSFNEFKINSVKFVTDEGGRQIVRMEGFGFGARIPIQTGMVASNSAMPINYENTGLNTDISMREGEAVVVGTLNVGPSGDAIILVMSAKRANK
ncbi:MAG: hypothetical protein H7Z16_01740 [Pyrinomonadaceae bacterium]|nr:hypothetical protein [Pyrinomonadaceae bacterium]